MYFNFTFFCYNISNIKNATIKLYLVLTFWKLIYFIGNNTTTRKSYGEKITKNRSQVFTLDSEGLVKKGEMVSLRNWYKEFIYH